MADLLHLEVATPERLVIREQVTEAQIPAKSGYVGILPGHAPLMAELGTGLLTYVVDGRKRYAMVNRGFLEVLNDQIRVLTYSAERADEIDVKRAKAALERAQRRLETNNEPGLDAARAMAAFERATARLAAASQKES
jgi:F-type H+-transporting ATPase subunit epsilon